MPEFTIDVILSRYQRVGCHEKTLRTRKADGYCVTQLLRKLGGYWLTFDSATTRRKVLTGAIVRQYRELRKQEGVKPITIQRELAVASVAVKWCISEEDWDIPNPFEGRLISKADRKAIKPMGREISVEEERRLLLAAEQPMQDIIRFALSTGLRHDECRMLTWDRIDGSRILFRPDDHKSRREGISAMNAMARAIVERQPKVCAYVFSCEGAQMTPGRFDWLWKKARLRSEVATKFHDLRHTFARRALTAGASMEDIRAQLRHEKMETTEKVYARSGFESALRAVEAL